MRNGGKTSFYLAAPYDRKEFTLSCAYDLKNLGFIVTSSWLTGEKERDLGEQGFGSEEFNRFCAETDINDIDSADMLISFLEGPPVWNSDGRYYRGGRTFETGYAYGRQMPVILIGNKEHVFHSLSDIHYFTTWDYFLEYLKENTYGTTS